MIHFSDDMSKEERKYYVARFSICGRHPVQPHQLDFMPGLEEHTSSDIILHVNNSLVLPSQLRALSDWLTWRLVCINILQSLDHIQWEDPQSQRDKQYWDMSGKAKLWLVSTRFLYLQAFLVISLIIMMIICYSSLSAVPEASGSVSLRPLIQQNIT